MKLQIFMTEEFYDFRGAICRKFNGVTENGTKVTVMVAGIGIDANKVEWEPELKNLIPISVNESKQPEQLGLIKK